MKEEKNEGGHPLDPKDSPIEQFLGFWRWLRSKTAGFDAWLIQNYPKIAVATKLLVLIILVWTVWELTRQDYKSRAVCSFFYEKTEQIGECAFPQFYCGIGGEGGYRNLSRLWNTSPSKSWLPDG